MLGRRCVMVVMVVLVVAFSLMPGRRHMGRGREDGER